MTSATYRQSSKVTPELYERRIPTTGCWRAARVFAWTPRWCATSRLSASGLLNPAVGGPSVLPPAPAFPLPSAGELCPKVWNESNGADRYRRALYTFRFRSVPYPMLQTFDAPNGDTSCVRRARSNTPLQALTTLNEPVFVESARALGAANIDAKAARTDAQRLAYAFRRCVARTPNRRGTRRTAAASCKRKSSAITTAS